MKRYIKSAVETDIYLRDWITKHKDNHPDRIVIDDRTPYTGKWEEWNGESYIDCPGVVFIGTYDQLLSGGGDNLLFETYGKEEYQKQLDRYYIIDEEVIESVGKPETWLYVELE